MDIIKLEADHIDDRGAITDLVEEDINSITMVTFEPDAVRGNHYHKETVQYNLVLSGSIEFKTQLEGEDVQTNILGKGGFIKIYPNESHALKGLTESELIVFARGPRSGKDYEADTYRLDDKLI